MSNEISIKKIPYDESSILFSTSLIFEQNIDILWLYLKDFERFN